MAYGVRGIMNKGSYATKYLFIFGVLPIILSILIALFAIFNPDEGKPYTLFFAVSLFIMGMIGGACGRWIGTIKDVEGSSKK